MNMNNSYDKYLWYKLFLIIIHWKQKKLWENKSFVGKKNTSVDTSMRKEHVVKE